MLEGKPDITAHTSKLDTVTQTVGNPGLQQNLKLNSETKNKTEVEAESRMTVICGNQYERD